jgi:uncharacterized protein YycO
MNDLTLYEKYRQEMQTGDALLYRSSTWLGWAIRLFSPRYNHAGLVVRLNQYEGAECRVWTLEALEHGVVLNYLSRRLIDTKGEVWWYPLKTSYNAERPRVGEYALTQSGQPYDYKSLFKNILGRVSANARELFCSELAFLSWQYAGIVKGSKAPRPGDIPGLGIFLDPIKII